MFDSIKIKMQVNEKNIQAIQELYGKVKLNDFVLIQFYCSDKMTNTMKLFHKILQMETDGSNVHVIGNMEDIDKEIIDMNEKLKFLYEIKLKAEN